MAAGDVKTFREQRSGAWIEVDASDLPVQGGLTIVPQRFDVDASRDPAAVELDRLAADLREHGARMDAAVQATEASRDLHANHSLAINALDERVDRLEAQTPEDMAGMLTRRGLELQAEALERGIDIGRRLAEVRRVPARPEEEAVEVHYYKVLSSRMPGRRASVVIGKGDRDIDRDLSASGVVTAVHKDGRVEIQVDTVAF